MPLNGLMPGMVQFDTVAGRDSMIPEALFAQMFRLGSGHAGQRLMRNVG
jgi:hypothetical protein